MKTFGLTGLTVLLCFWSLSATAQKNPAALDMRPAAVCERLMNDEFKRSQATETYFAEMEQSQREDLWNRTLKCIGLLGQGNALKVTAFLLEQITWYRGFYKGFDSGFDSGAKRASEQHDKAYDALVDRYNSLVDRYNSLARAGDALIGAQNAYDSLQSHVAAIDKMLASRPTPVSSLPSFVPPPPPPPQELYLNCTATPLPGNSAAVNCW